MGNNGVCVRACVRARAHACVCVCLWLWCENMYPCNFHRECRCGWLYVGAQSNGFMKLTKPVDLVTNLPVMMNVQTMRKPHLCPSLCSHVTQNGPELMTTLNFVEMRALTY